MCGNNNGGGGGNNNGGGQISLSCASDATFQLETFQDSYCLTRTGNTYNSLTYFNNDMKQLSCVNVYPNNAGSSLIQYLIGISASCSSLDSGLCGDSEAAQERQSYVGKSSSMGLFHHQVSAGGQSWFTKLKYVTGGLLLLASFVMFTGILFTNRRRRRALMQRKYRQAKRNSSGGRMSSDRSRRTSGRSVSKHRSSEASRKSVSRSRRSKSRDPRERESPRQSSGGGRYNSQSNVGENGGIMT